MQAVLSKEKDRRIAQITASLGPAPQQITELAARRWDSRRPFALDLRSSHLSATSYRLCGSIGEEVRALDLSRNNLTTLGLDHLPVLESLDLSHNQLKDVTGLEEGLPAKHLDLSHNQLKNVAGLEEGLSALKHLDLSNATLRRVPPHGTF